MLRKYAALYSLELYWSGTMTLSSNQKMKCVTDLEQALEELKAKLISNFGIKGSNKLSNLKATITVLPNSANTLIYDSALSSSLILNFFEFFLCAPQVLSLYTFSTTARLVPTN